MSSTRIRNQRFDSLECLEEEGQEGNPPAHRQSLSRPTFISIPPRPSMGMKAPLSSANLTTAPENSSTQSLERPVEPHDHMQRSGRDDWMVKFCVEPAGDCSTCCQGIWCPCMLYSKTQYRLYQLAKGKDARIVGKRRKCDGPCWAFCGLAVIQLSCILTAFQHTRVRSRYEVLGSLCQDFSTAIFCNSCALMQDDREVRAREGDLHLRTNPKQVPSPSIEMVQAAPRQSHPMRYISPEPEAGQSGASNINGFDSEPNNLEGLAIHRFGQNMSNNNPIYFPSFPLHKNSKKDRSNSVPNKLRKQKPGKPNNRTSSLGLHHAPSTVNLDKPIRHHKIRGRNHQGSRNTTPTGTSGPSRGYHKAVPAYSTGVATHEHGNQAIQTRLNSFVFGSSSTHNLSDGEDELEGLNTDPRSRSHNLADCNIDGGRVGGRFQNKLAARPFVSTSSVSDYQHSLSQDPVIRGRTVPELSYIHDFEDCPIDGNVLDYLDEEERRYQQQARAQRGRASSAAGSASANHYLHMLADCYDAENGQQASNDIQSRPSLRSRRLASYPTRSNRKFTPANLPDRLVSCPPNCPRGARSNTSHRTPSQKTQTEQPGEKPVAKTSSPDTKAKGKGRGNEIEDEQSTRGRSKHSRGSWRTKERAISGGRNTWAGKKHARYQPELRHNRSTGHLNTPAESPTSNEPDTDAVSFLSLTQEPSKSPKKRASIEPTTGQYSSRDIKSATDLAATYGTMSRRRSTDEKNALLHALVDCAPPQPVEGTAQHALAQCLAIDEGRKLSRRNESAQVDRESKNGSAPELRHTRSEEVLRMSPLPTSPETERPRGKSQSEIEVRKEGKGKSWSWWDF